MSRNDHDDGSESPNCRGVYFEEVKLLGHSIDGVNVAEVARFWPPTLRMNRYHRLQFTEARDYVGRGTKTKLELRGRKSAPYFRFT
jgi:hypothetical protein